MAIIKGVEAHIIINNVEAQEYQDSHESTPDSSHHITRYIQSASAATFKIAVKIHPEFEPRSDTTLIQLSVDRVHVVGRILEPTRSQEKYSWTHEGVKKEVNGELVLQRLQFTDLTIGINTKKIYS